jgi:pimeloyl-ACP methyl ester carboxylesterase
MRYSSSLAIYAMLKRKKIFLIPTGLLLGFMIFLHSCMNFRMSKQEVDTFFARRDITATQHKYKTGFREIHYVKAGDESKPLVLFIHGSPGSLSAFIHFLTDSILLHRALLISTDRPGFGHSNFGNAEGSLSKQSEALKPILEQYKNNRPVILVGHSLGGPLIARMAMDYPELVDGLIIVAGSIDPELEPNETWFRAPLATPFLSWIVPRSFRASNEEIYHLKPELEKMLPLWKNITCPVIVIHGKKDQLVDFENVAFAKKMLVNASVEYMIKDDMNHFVPWSNPELIREAVLTMLSHSTTAEGK